MIVRDKDKKYISFGKDPVGNIFLYKNKLYREIFPEKEMYVKKLLSSGLIDELIEKNLFPKTTISKHKSKSSNLLIEHKILDHQTYPHEWTFEMLKDAALTTLEINRIAIKYGYQTVDAHTGNILQSKNKQYFVDLGSFVQLPENSESWFAVEEFHKLFIYPLKLWSNGFDAIVESQLLKNTLSHGNYLYIKYPFLRIFKKNVLNKFFFAYFLALRISAVDKNAIKNKVNSTVFYIYNLLIKMNGLPFSKVNISREIQKIRNIKNNSKSYWGDYQTNSTLESSERLATIKKIVNKLNPESITDLASNQGAFAISLASNNRSIHCIDYDRNAIDALYLKLKNIDQDITCYSENIIFPTCLNEQIPITTRAKSDLVLALAVTHHLSLSQNISFQTIINSIKKYTTKYLLIEFMPLGLWNGKNSISIPSWYTKSNFEIALKKDFKINQVKQLEINRILYVCELL